MNIFFSQIFKCFDIVVNIEVTVFISDFDRIVNIDAFNSGYMQPVCFYIFFHCVDTFPAPDFSRSRIVQGCDHSGYSGNLSNLF